MSKKPDKDIEPIPDKLENVVNSIFQQATNKQRNIKELIVSTIPKQATPKQFPLDLGVEIQKDVNGVEMGVLENGIPYLTQRGLSRITGVARNVLQTITQEWEEHYGDNVISKDRISFLKQYLFSNGYTERKLYIESKKDGTIHYAYPDAVCMALLEYYAFESKSDSPVALENYRKFATFGLRKFIYEALGYTPSDKWKYYHDRVSILKDSVPVGYFSVFHEIPGMVVDLINADLTVNDKTVPDISVGIHWAKHWKAQGLSQHFGERIPYEHNYPAYYPQSMSNPQDANAYPDTALAEFRRWFRAEYLLTKFPQYILSKANMLPGGKEEVLRIASMYQGRQLPPPR